MIINKFKIKEMNYIVGLNQISLDLTQLMDLHNLKHDNEVLDYIFNLIEEIQKKYDESIVQFLNDKFLLNQDHLFSACYYTLKAFMDNINISNKKNLELFLYLATQRQIKNGIKSFGIEISNLKDGKLNFCIISSKNNLDKINYDILQKMNGVERNIDINHITLEKFKRIKEFFKISENQIKSILSSYGFNLPKENEMVENLQTLFLALHDLICEKMALLSLEKVKTN